MSKQTQIIFAIGLVIVVLIGGYFLFFNNNNQSTAVSATAAPSSADEATFIALTQELQPISFDPSVTAILTDPRFTSLIDIHTPILPEATGRTDPFAPI